MCAMAGISSPLSRRSRRATLKCGKWWNKKDCVFFITMVFFATLALMSYSLLEVHLHESGRHMSGVLQTHMHKEVLLEMMNYSPIEDRLRRSGKQMRQGLQISTKRRTEENSLLVVKQEDAKKLPTDKNTRKDFVLDKAPMKDPLVGMLLAKDKYLPSFDKYKNMNQLINAKALGPLLGADDFVPTNVLRDHRVPPIGMKVQAPWASGLSLRRTHQKMRLAVKGEDSSMILYAHPFDDEYTSENFCFYVEMLSRSFRIMEASSSPFAHKNVTHVFIVCGHSFEKYVASKMTMAIAPQQSHFCGPSF